MLKSSTNPAAFWFKPRLAFFCAAMTGFAACTTVQHRSESDAASPASPAAAQPSTSAPVPTSSTAMGAGAGPGSTAPDSPDLQSKVQALSAQIQELQRKLDTSEEKLAALNEKVNDSRAGQNALKSGAAPVRTHPSAESGETPSLMDPTESVTGFDQSTPVQSFREGMSYFQSKRFADAILSFSNFLKEHADHPLAPAAQFHLADAYFSQQEYRLSLDEFQRVLLSYPRSSYAADALARLSVAYTKAGKPADGSRYKERLLATFPGSPAARGWSEPTAPKAAEPAIDPNAPAPLTAPLPAVPAPVPEEGQKHTANDYI